MSGLEKEFKVSSPIFFFPPIFVFINPPLQPAFLRDGETESQVCWGGQPGPFLAVLSLRGTWLRRPGLPRIRLAAGDLSFSDSDLPDDSQQGGGRFLGESVGSDPGRELAERSSGASETALFLARPLLSVTWSHSGRWSVSTKSGLPRAMPPSRSFGLYSAPQQTSGPLVPGAVQSPGGHDPCPLGYRGRAGKMK